MYRLFEKNFPTLEDNPNNFLRSFVIQLGLDRILFTKEKLVLEKGKNDKEEETLPLTPTTLFHKRIFEFLISRQLYHFFGNPLYLWKQFSKQKNQNFDVKTLNSKLEVSFKKALDDHFVEDDPTLDTMFIDKGRMRPILLIDAFSSDSNPTTYHESKIAVNPLLANEQLSYNINVFEDPLVITPPIHLLYWNQLLTHLPILKPDSKKLVKIKFTRLFFSKNRNKKRMYITKRQFLKFFLFLEKSSFIGFLNKKKKTLKYKLFSFFILLVEFVKLQSKVISLHQLKSIFCIYFLFLFYSKDKFDFNLSYLNNTISYFYKYKLNLLRFLHRRKKRRRRRRRRANKHKVNTRISIQQLRTKKLNLQLQNLNTNVIKWSSLNKYNNFKFSQFHINVLRYYNETNNNISKIYSNKDYLISNLYLNIFYYTNPFIDDTFKNFLFINKKFLNVSSNNKILLFVFKYLSLDLNYPEFNFFYKRLSYFKVQLDGSHFLNCIYYFVHILYF
ncbi:MAG: hypothetical protein ACXW07_05715 [Nitrososphaeraceae archaeon]